MPAQKCEHALTTELVIYDTDLDLVESLERHSKSLPFMHCELGYGPDVSASASLDAMWASPMVGVELFGATPPFPLHEALVLATPRSQRDRGLPPYGIVGVAMAEDDPETPEYVLRLKVNALLRCVHQHNLGTENKICRVGILPEDLEIDTLGPEVAIRIIREVYHDHEKSLRTGNAYSCGR